MEDLQYFQISVTKVLRFLTVLEKVGTHHIIINAGYIVLVTYQIVFYVRCKF